MPGHREVERVRRLAGLEEDVGVLGGAAHDRGIRRHARGARNASTSSSRTSARRSSSSSSAILSISCEVRKPSKKCRNGTRGAQRRGVGDEREVVRLLDRARREHRPAGRAGVHHVAVVAEDRERVGRDGPGGDVDHRGRQLAGDLEHVGDHQQQALRRGERRRRARPSAARRAARRPRRPRTASRRRPGPRPRGSAARPRTSRRSARPSARPGVIG